MNKELQIDAIKKDLSGKRVVVVGMATTGMAAAEFLVKQGAAVIVSEQKAEHELGASPQRLRSLGVKMELGKHSPQTFLSGNLIVLSPGVDPAIPPLEQARVKGIPIVSEVELASWFINLPLIAITGTNGKSTTTSLIGHILSGWGKKVFVGGNIGIPLTNHLLRGEEADYIVAEISSFQLEAISSFRPWIALLLNVGEDHLTRHPTLSSYAAAKARIFLNQGPKDWAVINHDDAIVRTLIPQIRAQLLTFSREGKKETGVWLEDRNTIVYKNKGGEERFSLTKVKIKGMHNCENIMAAIGAAKVCGVPQGVLQKSLESFEGLEHRLELVGEWRGVSVYNDSKATNVASAITALQSLEGPIILLAGGRDKGGAYSPLRGIIKERAKALILMGEAQSRMQAAFQDLAPVHLVDGMEDGVILAWKLAQGGDVILLSPACSSFDMFQDYQERGRIFKEMVLKLAGGEG
ncbi:MAG: UDP-N-acetylmuramoylalanine--D-glutamate ligase [Deltaproteobacteria bacterium RBG_13_52_11]|nr:MAG: UDP-N-acetylmuramoylalanine--D-glutamate ligase [Deltaproteobacteria bacterium RBG_13_52_11]